VSEVRAEVTFLTTQVPVGAEIRGGDDLWSGNVMRQGQLY